MLVKARVQEVKKTMTSTSAQWPAAPLAHTVTRSKSDCRSRAERIERENAIAEAELAVLAKMNKIGSIFHFQSVNENLKIETELDEGTIDNLNENSEDEESDEDVANKFDNKKETWSDVFEKQEGDSISFDVEEVLIEIT